MGADLILAWADYPPADVDIPAAIAALPDDKLTVIYEEWQGEPPQSDYDEALDDEPFETNWRAETRQRLQEAFHGVTGDNARDVSVVVIHGHTMLIGGGTSWGDTPDGYNDVAFIALSGIGQKEDS